jgi:hypothetical protein
VPVYLGHSDRVEVTQIARSDGVSAATRGPHRGHELDIHHVPEHVVASVPATYHKEESQMSSNS